MTPPEPVADASTRAGTPASGSNRRGALLRLAGWFDSADPATAEELARAVFGLHPARQLTMRASAPSDTIPSWWSGPRTGRAAADAGAPAADIDHAGQRRRLRDAAVAASGRRRGAAREVRQALGVPTAGEGESSLELSDTAFAVLLEMLTAAFADAADGRPAPQVTDTALDLRLHLDPAPQAAVRMSDSQGALRFTGLRLWATAIADEEHDAVG